MVPKAHLWKAGICETIVTLFAFEVHSLKDKSVSETPAKSASLHQVVEVDAVLFSIAILLSVLLVNRCWPVLTKQIIFVASV